MPTSEHARLREVYDDAHSWRRWGPYVGDRAWATVREDYSANGEAWTYLPHDLARSKAYRWGEDGIAALCDRYQLLVMGPAFWNEMDPFLKERLFGVTPLEGNHGEDVKEYYFYLDNTPTHSYMRALYKYPQQEFPYRQLVEENQRRAGQGFEYELLDTGVFNEDRYFDIFIEYAKIDTEDIGVRITAINRGPDAAPLHILPQLWFRNTWEWDRALCNAPLICEGARGNGFISLLADDQGHEALPTVPGHYKLGPRMLYAQLGGTLLFTNNETNAPRVYGPDIASRTPFVKDAFHRHVVSKEDSINPARQGTKAALHYHFPTIPRGGSVTVLLRLSPQMNLIDPLAIVEPTLAQRKQEADEFYAHIAPAGANADERNIQRQALSGLLWNKQCYIFDVAQWLDGQDGPLPSDPRRRTIRNVHWRHLNSLRVMSLPDKWEYPWFAAWDSAFHCVALALVDPQYAKDQLRDLLFEQFQHPNGQLPAYEWEFSDMNPPVHAWAVWRVFNMARIRTGRADRAFLESCFHKLLLNFTWWINKVDSSGNNIFEGGFLGLDNITVVDRSRNCQDGSVLEQSDATGWMGMFSLNMMRIALELAKENSVYEGLATKFFQHYIYIASAMKHMGGRDYQLWDERDGFFYDVLQYPDGGFHKFRVRSLVGLIPLFAVERIEANWIEPFQQFSGCMEWFLTHRASLAQGVVQRVEHDGQVTYVLTIVNAEQLERILNRVWDSSEFLSPYGVRSLSKAHRDEPFVWNGLSVNYEPAEAVVKLKGGNSNWRGPIWFPTSFLLIESLRKLGKAYGSDFRIATSQHHTSDPTFHELAEDLAERLIRIFRRDESGRRAVYGAIETFQSNPHWRDLILFYEYFHADNGAGLGASHQTGWTALVASLIDEWRK